MRAWRVGSYGEPAAALRLAETAAPVEPGPAAAAACASSRRPANFPDVLLCRGEYQVRPDLPFTPGVEACGEVVAVGSECDRLRGRRPGESAPASSRTARRGPRR